MNTLQPRARTMLFTGCLLLGIAVLIGAFGAHGLKSMVSANHLATFETGVRYHFYHGFGLLVCGILQHLFPQTELKFPAISFFGGILFFSFNCYLYVVTGLKFFAIIVPIGGIMFAIGWFWLGQKVLKLWQTK